MPSKKKKYNARFPAGRIKKIMQTDEEVGKVAQAVPVIISRTLELFVESLLKKSMQITLSRNAKTLTPSHMKQCILSESRFDFLKDLVKDVPDASVQEDNENNDIFEDGFNHNDVDVEAPAPLPSHSKRKHSTTEAGPKDRLVHKIELTGPREPKKRKLPATEVSSPSSSSSSSPYSVPSSPHLIPPPTAANYYKDHQQQQSTSTRTPVIQYSPKLTQNHNQNADSSSQASQLTFSVNSLLSQTSNNVISSEDSNLRITVAPDHLSSPPVAGTTSSSKAGSVVSPKLTPSENVPPLVPLRVPPAPVASPPTQGSSPKYRPAPGDLSIDEDYDN